jgi:hypothetical protein
VYLLLVDPYKVSKRLWLGSTLGLELQRVHGDAYIIRFGLIIMTYCS